MRLWPKKSLFVNNNAIFEVVFFIVWNASHQPDKHFLLETCLGYSANIVTIFPPMGRGGVNTGPSSTSRHLCNQSLLVLTHSFDRSEFIIVFRVGLFSLSHLCKQYQCFEVRQKRRFRSPEAMLTGHCSREATEYQSRLIYTNLLCQIVCVIPNLFPLACP